jgi:hypothetical protein
MSFREVISNFQYRRRLEAEVEQYENIKPPPNPSRRYIDKLVLRLLNERAACNARRELELIGPAAVPSLLAALVDPRFHRAECEKFEPAVRFDAARPSPQAFDRGFRRRDGFGADDPRCGCCECRAAEIRECEPRKDRKGPASPSLLAGPSGPHHTCPPGASSTFNSQTTSAAET